VLKEIFFTGPESRGLNMGLTSIKVKVKVTFTL